MASTSATPSFIDATISTPQQLADALRRSGGFDSLRRSLMTDFMASPDKDLLLSRLDEILPAALSKPSFKAKAKKDRQVDLMREVETRYTMLQKSVQEVERGVRAREREREGRGRKGVIGGELERTLRRSRGELVEEEEEEEEEEEVPEAVKTEQPLAPPSATAAAAAATPTLRPPPASTEPPAIPTPPPTHLLPSPPPAANPAPSLPGLSLPTTANPPAIPPLPTSEPEPSSRPAEEDIKMEDSVPPVSEKETIVVAHAEILSSEIPSEVEESALEEPNPAPVDADVKMEDVVAHTSL